MKLVLRWGIFPFRSECDHQGHWPHLVGGVHPNLRKFRRNFPLGQSLILCSRTLTRFFLVPHLVDQYPEPLLCQLCWHVRLILIAPELSLIQRLAQLPKSDNRFSWHFKFLNVTHLAEPSCARWEGNQHRKMRRRIRKRFRRTLGEMIHNGQHSFLEMDLVDCFFTSRHQFDALYPYLSLDLQRLELPSGLAGADQLGLFTSLTHLTWPWVCPFFSGPFPPHLRHLHLGHLFETTAHSFSLEALPSSLECLHFHCGGQVCQSNNTRPWDDFFKRCVRLRKLKLVSFQGTLPASLFHHANLERLECLESSITFPSPVSSHGGRLRHLVLPPSTLKNFYDDPGNQVMSQLLAGLSSLTHLSFNSSRANQFSILNPLSTLPFPTGWPQHLDTLILNNFFSESLAPLRGLVLLRRLRLGSTFNQPIARDHWPPALQCLVISALPLEQNNEHVPMFPRHDLSDLHLHFSLNRFPFSRFHYQFDYLPPSLSILLVGVDFNSNPHRYPTQMEIQVTSDPRFPECRLCGFRPLLTLQ